jgi:hypothetical protein
MEAVASLLFGGAIPDPPERVKGEWNHDQFASRKVVLVITNGRDRPTFNCTKRGVFNATSN